VEKPPNTGHLSNKSKENDQNATIANVQLHKPRNRGLARTHKGENLNGPTKRAVALALGGSFSKKEG